MKAGIDRESRESYEIELTFALICPGSQPASVSVSFTDANGEDTERLGEPCQGEWANNSTAPPNPLTEWSVTGFGGLPLPEGFGSPPYVLFSPPPEARGIHPFLYEVKSASGIIAQAPITAISTPEQRITEGSPAYQEDCVAKGEVKKTAAGSGYCVIAGTTTYSAGWPTPTAPVQPTAITTVILCANSNATARVPRIKPTRCSTLGPHQALYEDANLADLHWRGWGQPEATATGIELGAHLPLAHIPIQVRAYRLRQCSDATKRYTRLRTHDRYGSRILSFAECPTH